jgi:hypothetical protein
VEKEPGLSVRACQFRAHWGCGYGLAGTGA